MAASIDNIKSRALEVLAPIPRFKGLEKFHYPDYKDKTSPFKMKRTNKNEIIVLDGARIKEPLEHFSIESFRFVGLIKNRSIVWALISNNSKEVSSIKLGDYLGKNEGKIIEIGDNSLRVEERFYIHGKLVKKIKIMDLTSPGK